jgi:hypothetical protein
MTETPELSPDDEIGQEDALEAPEGDYEDDEYIEDPDYDPENDEIDPELMSEGLGATGIETPSEGGDI